MKTFTVMSLLAGVAFEPTAHSGDREIWEGVFESCQEVDLPEELSSFVTDSDGWSSSLDGTERSVQSFTEEVCPRYLNRANANAGIGVETTSLDQITVQDFTARQAALWQSATRARAKELELKEWIDDAEDEFAPIYEALGDDFAESECGGALLGARDHVEARIQALQVQIEKIGGRCDSVAREMAKGPALVATAGAARTAPAASASPAPVPAGRSVNPSSDITGLDREAAKRAREKEILGF